jgi:transcriptional regulator with XRE-family HTH domain
MDTIGKRLRAARKRRKVSLRELSEEVGVSASFLSQVERGQVMLSINSLRRISDALKIPAGHLIENPPTRDPVVRHDQRMRLALPGSEVELENLTPGLDHRMQVFLCTMNPGEVSNKEFLSHASDEFIYILTGELEVTVDQDVYFLYEGDSILFNGIQLHRFRCSGDEPVKYIIVNTPPVQ